MRKQTARALLDFMELMGLSAMHALLAHINLRQETFPALLVKSTPFQLT
jgi:hypothetical protein